jgi:hypothetical protein
METWGSVKSDEAVQGEKSTLFLSFLDPASKDVAHDPGDGSGVSVVNMFEALYTCEPLLRCPCLAELSGGLGRDSDRRWLGCIAVSVTLDKKLERRELIMGSETSTSEDVMFQSKRHITTVKGEISI